VRTLDFVMDQAMRVAMLVVVNVRVCVCATATADRARCSDRLRQPERRQVAMSATVGVAVHALAVTVLAGLHGFGHAIKRCTALAACDDGSPGVPGCAA
jgi:hypothetical protein